MIYQMTSSSKASCVDPFMWSMGGEGARAGEEEASARNADPG
uniref:Uncharacterized protein n=1 Tax=Arundo donax TaxID=35708 RepID=A0A0A9H7J6_ARUDO